MDSHPGEISPAAAVPRLLVELPSWPRVFFGNLRDLALPRHFPPLELTSAPAPFWPDVFVRRRLPWSRFVQSCACHLLAFSLFAAASHFFSLRPQVAPSLAFDPRTQVIYYEPSEYLPPLDTRTEPARKPAKADPEFSRQEVISLPPEADNRSQTIVTPPNINLKRDVALPNIVRWSDAGEMPRLAIPSIPLTAAAEINRMAPRMANSVVAPPPDLRSYKTSGGFAAPEPAVIAPAPSVESASPRRLGELEIGRTAVIAPAPRLTVEPQHAVSGGRSSGVTGMARVIAPPPAVGGGRGVAAGGSGRVVALNLQPAIGAPPDPPVGNRRGTFSATPAGHSGASGDPGARAGAGKTNGASTINPRGSGELPSGLYVGGAPAAKTSGVAGDPAANSSSGSLARHPGSTTPAKAESGARISEAERSVFGDRKIYSLTLSMPNLNSAGGSWIVRFAELDHKNKRDPSLSTENLSQPNVIHKVDPGYPTSLIKENVAGMVILYAVIRSDGRVGNVRVLRGVDDRLDDLAKEAIAKWRFQPAVKNGSAIDVEATFQIPFLPPRIGTNF